MGSRASQGTAPRSGPDPVQPVSSSALACELIHGAFWPSRLKLELSRGAARINYDKANWFSKSTGGKRMTLNANSPTDAELLRRMLAGDEDAFVALYRRRQSGIYRFALQMCGSVEIAEDVTQEVFMVLMREGEKYDSSRGSLAAYLYGIARHHVLRQLARDRHYVLVLDQDEEGNEPQPPEQLIAQTDLLSDLTRNQTIERVRQAVLALPAHYREVVALCELHEMSYVEAAGVLDCAVGTVRSRLHRARALLTEKLRDAGTDEAAREEARAKKLEAENSTAQTVNSTRCFA